MEWLFAPVSGEIVAIVLLSIFFVVSMVMVTILISKISFYKLVIDIAAEDYNQLLDISDCQTQYIKRLENTIKSMK